MPIATAAISKIAFNRPRHSITSRSDPSPPVNIVIQKKVSMIGDEYDDFKAKLLRLGYITLPNILSSAMLVIQLHLNNGNIKLLKFTGSFHERKSEKRKQ